MHNADRSLKAYTVVLQSHDMPFLTSMQLWLYNSNWFINRTCYIFPSNGHSPRFGGATTLAPMPLLHQIECIGRLSPDSHLV